MLLRVLVGLLLVVVAARSDAAWSGRVAAGVGYGYGQLPFDNDDPRLTSFASATESTVGTTVSTFGMGSGSKARAELLLDLAPGYSLVAGMGLSYLPIDTTTPATTKSFGGGGFFVGPLPTPVSYSESGTRTHSFTFSYVPLTLGVEAASSVGRVSGTLGIGAGVILPRPGMEWTSYTGEAQIVMLAGAPAERWTVVQASRAEYRFLPGACLYESVGLRVRLWRGLTAHFEVRLVHAALVQDRATLSGNYRAENTARSQHLDGTIDGEVRYTRHAPQPDVTAPEVHVGSESCNPYLRITYDDGQSAYDQECRTNIRLDLDVRRTERLRLARSAEVDVAAVDATAGLSMAF